LNTYTSPFGGIEDWPKDTDQPRREPKHRKIYTLLTDFLTYRPNCIISLCSAVVFDNIAKPADPIAAKPPSQCAIFSLLNFITFFPKTMRFLKAMQDLLAPGDSD
jgi:hypothetical protein